MLTSTLLSLPIHLTGLALFLTAFSRIPYITNPLHFGFGSSFQFLTFIGLLLSTIVFILSLLLTLPALSHSPFLSSIKTKLSLIATPIEVLITVLYWSLYAVNKDWVTPPGHALPLLMNLGCHAVPGVMLVIDFLVLSDKWEEGLWEILGIDGVFVGLYWCWLEVCFGFNGWYPYPGLMRLDALGKLYIAAELAVGMMGCTLLLYWIHGRIHGARKIRSAAAGSLKNK